MDPILAADAMAHPRHRAPPTIRQSTADTIRARAHVMDGLGFDPDTCRICRGEATAEEPLFYPCKCSGSIKFVHQDCLMEWLSHSQKKHCELCKTPFRFTKLYSPKMPNTLPVHIFFGHVAKYLFRNILVWLRVALVALVWLAVLPWAMRTTWTFMFWISDEGLGSSDFWKVPEVPTWQHNLPAHYPGPVLWDDWPEEYYTCLLPHAYPTGRVTTPEDVAWDVLSSWLRYCPVSLSESPRAFRRKEFPTHPFASALLRSTFRSPSPPKFSNTLHPWLKWSIQDAAKPKLRVVREHPPSLLGGLGFLRNLTRLPILNRTIINILEGQIITVLVIVSFILVILVRDYVVQQQPEINMRAAFAANEAQAAQMPHNHHEHEHEHDHHHHHQQQHNDEGDHQIEGEREPAGPDNDEDGPALPSRWLRPPNPDHEIIAGRDPDETDNGARAASEPRHNHGGHQTQPFTSGNAASPSTTGDDHPAARDMRPLASVGQAAGDGNKDDPESPVATVALYMRIYRQAEGDPYRILQAIKDENLEEKMEYWTRLTQSLLDKANATLAERERAKRAGSAQAKSNPSSSQAHLQSGSVESLTAGNNPSTSVQLPAPRDIQPGQVDRRDAHGSSGADKGRDEEGEKDQKGKGKQKESVRHGPPPALTPEPAAGLGNPVQFHNALRPRSASDAPMRHESISALANNSWSFAPVLNDLPPEAGGSSNLPKRPPQEPSNPFTTELSSRSQPLPPQQGQTQGGPARRRDAERTELASELGSAHLPFHRPDGGADLDNASLEALAGASTAQDQPAPDAPTGGVPQRPLLQRGVMDRLADFMWGDIEIQQRAVAPAVPLPGGDDPFDDDLEDTGDENGETDESEDESDLDDDDLPDLEDELDDDNDDDDDDDVARDPEVVEAAVAAGLDPEALDDAEDMEGVLEIIGVRGPMIALVQNALFVSVLVSSTIFFCVFLPYNLGRVSVWAGMHPTRILYMLFSFTKFVQDIAVAALTGACSGFLAVMYYVGTAFGWWLPSARRSCESLMIHTWGMSANASSRAFDAMGGDLFLVSAAEVQNFSAISHESLVAFKELVSSMLTTLGHSVDVVSSGDLLAKSVAAFAWAMDSSALVFHSLSAVSSKLLYPSSWVIRLGGPEHSLNIDPVLTSWSGSDRFLAVLLGYLTLTALCALYLRRGTPISSGQTIQEYEAALIDVLNQASGVLKVIMIISIEMLAFPLYCGLLLDAALLPLFEDATIKSRVTFTVNYPLTSIFVHWFVGTGYMFHFALFVSMCRKIMRKGVLYFIRDPDDPEFHPVRDVLERNVTTQLRKILFSAFVYGALVVVCLGGVVWGLSFTLPHVLPIHYSSNEPILEFPVDLLFYNFAMPLAVKFFRPKDRLHGMYTWWLRKCARVLRLTWFLFGERRIDEEGILSLRRDSQFATLPWWKRYFLELDVNEVVPKTWDDRHQIFPSKPPSTILTERMIGMNGRKSRLVQSGQLIPDGRFVRAPGSDQVKVPKGQAVFLQVTDWNTRLDRKLDVPDTDVYSTKQYQLVYLPPHFQLRIFLFILFVWLFAAITGVSSTIVPLILGRKIFKLLIPAHIRTNDIYAFSIGVYILGSAVYFASHTRFIVSKVKQAASSTLQTAKDASLMPSYLRSFVSNTAKVLYSYSILLIVFPLLLTSLMELYFIIPLHTYINPPSPYIIPTNAAAASPAAGNATTTGSLIPSNQHTTRVVQSWTLGLLYVQLCARIIVKLYRGTRPALAVRAIFQRGWLRPDANLLTRAFVLPVLLLGALALFGPAYAAKVLLDKGMLNVGPAPPAAAPHELTMIYRLSYPAAALSALAVGLLWSVIGVFNSWKVRIRDEAYLIGERLHNFGIAAAAGTNGAATAGQWTTRGARL